MAMRWRQIGALASTNIGWHSFGAPPQPLQIVIGTGALREDMDQEISVIHEDPLSCVVTLDTYRPFTPVLEHQLNFVAGCLTLADIRNRTDDKVISKGGYSLQVQYTDVECLF